MDVLQGSWNLCCGRLKKYPWAGVALLPAQVGELLRGFDACGHDTHSQAMRERDDGAHDGGIVRIVGDVADDGAIDLELVDVERLR